MRFEEKSLVLNTQREDLGWGIGTTLPFNVNENLPFSLKVEIGE